MIEFENVSFSYEGQEHGGLHGISLKIADGECVLFCGRSGCGKTTVTRLVNGLIPQFYQGELQGRVLVDGQEISNLPMYQIAAKVGSVFQNPRTQFFNVDTDSEIAFGIENEARPVKELEERVEQTTKDLHIEKLRNRNIFELSGGEKQKIAFASVYAMNPEIYLLDEPSSNLDMASIQELKEHLRLIKSQGKTILIAEHRLYYLMELADRIVYLEDGEIARIFTPEEFLRLPETEREHMGLRAVDLARVLPPASHPPISSPTLALHDVTLRYKKRTILHQIALSAAKGEVIGVVGHNGAGKTTFSRALCGLHKDCEGAFLWDDQPMEHKARLKRSYMVMQDVNHQVSKALVKNNPKHTLFVLEDLSGIRNATERVRTKDRYVSVSWSFYDLEQKLIYKAKQNQSTVIKVNPRYTSQCCPVCGHIEKANRNKKLHLFACKNCGYKSNDDRIGAMNLYRMGINYLEDSQVPNTVMAE